MKYNIKGMSCAVCSNRVEKAVSQVDGVEVCSVNLLTNSMEVHGNYNEDDIFKAVEKAGYGIEYADKISSDNESKKLMKIFLSSLFFLLILMYFSMGHMMFGFPVPDFLEKNHMASGILQLVLALIVIIINKRFFINGYKNFIARSPNMDTLVALGSASSFVYSTIALFKVSENYHSELYFESAAMILVLITVGKMLESYSKGKTTNAIQNLMNLKPEMATIVENGIEKTVMVSEVKVGDIFVVKPGESIPVDGIIIEGYSAINESAITGESIPSDKTVDDEVVAATINISGHIKCVATKVGNDTMLSQIIKLVSDASQTKAPIAKIADKVSGIFVPVVLVIAALTIIIWLLAGSEFGYAIARGVSVLVISCPCSLGLATPVAIMVGSGVGAKCGILFKNATTLENAGKINCVALDKTGTITEGNPKVTDIITTDDFTKEELLLYAYSVENKSEHPLAKSIVNYAREKNCCLYENEDFKSLPGNGLMAKVNDDIIYCGNLKFISEKADISDEIKDNYNKLSDEGKTVMFFAKGNMLMGIIAVFDVVKKDSIDAVKELKSMGIHTVIITGDSQNAANTVRKQIEADEVYSEVLPQEKEKIIRELKKKWNTAMVGDGINDAPALAVSDIGIAIGKGTDIAIDSADIVLINNKLKDIPALIRLSRKTLKNIYENLFWAFFYNAISIPVAAGVLIPLFNIKLNPMIGATAMSLSSFCVVVNALRLNLANIRDNTKCRIIISKKEKKIMVKTLNVEGMMCMHCEKRVKTVLEAVDGITNVLANHENNTVTVEMIKDISFEELKSIIENEGYKVIS